VENVGPRGGVRLDEISGVKRWSSGRKSDPTTQKSRDAGAIYLGKTVGDSTSYDTYDVGGGFALLEGPT